jgi:hypothetical protein
VTDTYAGTMERPVDGIWGYVGDVAITDDIVDWVVRDAEVGFPGATPTRGPGRPRSIDGDEPAVAVQFRLDRDRLRALDALAVQRGTSRSALLRDAVDRELTAV